MKFSNAHTKYETGSLSKTLPLDPQLQDHLQHENKLSKYYCERQETGDIYFHFFKKIIYIYISK